MIGPGDTGQFLAAPGITLTAADLNLWLSNLQATSGADQLNVIIDASKSGSFLAPADGADTLAAPNRVIIVSTAADQTASLSPEGALFSDIFFNALGQEKNLLAAFKLAARALSEMGAGQTPQMDGGLTSAVTALARPLTAAHSPGFLAQMRGLNTPYSPAPVVERLTYLRQPDGITVQLNAVDDQHVARVRVSLVACRGISPAPLLGLQTVEALPVAGSPSDYQATLTNLKGCALLAYAWDNSGIRSAPAVLSLMKAVYLPVAAKK